MEDTVKAAVLFPPPNIGVHLTNIFIKSILVFIILLIIIVTI